MPFWIGFWDTAFQTFGAFEMEVIFDSNETWISYFCLKPVSETHCVYIMVD